MAWEVRFENGVWLPQIGWWLDARYPVAKSFVSHAHFDHVAAHQVFLCSEGTAQLTRARLPGDRREIVLPFEQPHQLTPACEVRLFPAGHIYGSAQFHASHAEHGTLLYTGDFKLRPGLSAEKCATPRADVLIMETTFGLPRYVFPPTEQVLADIVAFCQQALHDDAVPVLFGYSLGKSQETLQALGRAQLPVMLHAEVVRMTQVYEQLGMRFPPYRPFDPHACGGHVVLCPPQAANSSFLRKIENRRTAMITGWAMDPGAKFRYQTDAAFPLSDHADFADLLAFVDRVQPSRVLTLHGFAREFAQTLRERGVEAWAIGQDNQLEFGIGASTVVASPVATVDEPACASAMESSAAPDSLARFAAVAETVKATASKLEKIAALQEYFASLPDDAATHAVIFFAGRPFSQADARTLNIGWSLLERAVLSATGASEADFRAAYGRFRDSGDTAEALFATRDRGNASGSLPLQRLADEFALLAATRGPTEKLERLIGLFRCLSGAEAKYVVKIVTGDLRIGLKEGLVEEALAASTGRTTDAVREANLLCGDLGSVMRAARADQLGAIELQPFRPLQFMLASPEPTAGALLARLTPPIWLEEKYDGIRCQIHKVGARVELFSRDLHNLTAQFPDLAAGAASIGCDFVADGELLAWRNGRALPFAELQKRLGRKGGDFFLGDEIPVSLSLYDLLWVDGHVLLKEPLRERRRHLEAIIPATHSVLVVAPVTKVSTELEIEAAFLRAKQRGNEGLMAKDPESMYSPGRRGLAWLKLKKAYATLDVVVVGVESGHGKRRDVLSDYTFAIRDDVTGRLLTVGKAYSGLTDAEIETLTAHFLEHTVEIHGRFRVVQPNVVLEVAFDRIQPSARHQSGYALRFPRIARLRPDKTPAQIDTLETCRKLAGVDPAAESEFDAAALFPSVAVRMAVTRFLVLLLSAAVAARAIAAPFDAFRDGEQFTYRVGFAIFNRAGEIVITAHEATTDDGRAVMRIQTQTASRGFVRGVYAFDNQAEVVIDQATGRLLSVRESGEDPKRATDSQTTFDYEQHVARHIDRTRPERSAEIPIPEGDPLDLISALVQTRHWNLQPGEKRDVLVHFGRDLYPLAIHAEGYEDVKTPLGKFRTLVLVPRMEKNPKGLFKRGGEIKVWIAQDGSKLPVKMQLKLNFGTAVLLLSEYRAPTSEARAKEKSAKTD